MVIGRNGLDFLIAASHAMEAINGEPVPVPTPPRCTVGAIAPAKRTFQVVTSARLMRRRKTVTTLLALVSYSRKSFLLTAKAKMRKKLNGLSHKQ